MGRAYTDGKLCTVAGCAKPQHAKGWCSQHYQSVIRSGSLANQRRIGFERIAPGGPDCHVCHRPLRDHGLTEFCELIDRREAV